MDERDLSLIKEASIKIQDAIDLLPCKSRDNCSSDNCRLYEACYSLVKAREKLEWMLLDEEIENK